MRRLRQLPAIMVPKSLRMPQLPLFQTNMTVFHHAVRLFAIRREIHE
jgi:hypothetical protein